MVFATIRCDNRNVKSNGVGECDLFSTGKTCAPDEEGSCCETCNNLTRDDLFRHHIMQTIDTAWFKRRLEARQRSLRGLARHMDLDPSAVSRMLSGQRKMQMDEASAIASFLSVPVKEVLKHAGVAVDLDGQPTRILLAATINEQGHIERLGEPKPLPQNIIDRAQAAVSKHGNGSIVAAQIRALNGPLALLDDAVVLFRHTDEVEASAIGALAVCRSYKGEHILAKIERARKTGEARVVCVDGKVREFDLHTATPVLALIP